MREIKFRCWIKKEKRMDNVDFINFAAQFTGKWECKEPDDLFDVATKRGRLFNLEDVELMQYTGVKDKNGKEVYEGDLIKIDWLKNVVFEVKYKQGCYILQSTQLMDNGEPKRCFYIFEINEMFLEVIGNVFKNPEFMEANNEK